MNLITFALLGLALSVITLLSHVGEWGRRVGEFKLKDQLSQAEAEIGVFRIIFPSTKTIHLKGKTVIC